MQTSGYFLLYQSISVNNLGQIHNASKDSRGKVILTQNVQPRQPGFSVNKFHFTSGNKLLFIKTKLCL